MEDQDKIWTVEDAAKILEITRDVVYKRAQTRKIKAGKCGGDHKRGLALLYSDADIESMRVDLRGRQQNAKK